MKIFHIVLSVLFVLFAVVQVNDPDPWAWVTMYAFVAGNFAFAAFQKFNRYAIWGGMLVCVVWFFTLIPDFIDWVNMGMPSITSSMKAEEPHIELTREFLGLLICLIALGYLHFRMRKAAQAENPK